MEQDTRTISEIITRLSETRLDEINGGRSLSSRKAVETLLDDRLGSRQEPPTRRQDKLLAPNQPIRSLRELGALLRARRKQLGYTQEELADGLGCSPRLIRETEQGRPTVGFERVMNHAMSLGIDLFARTRGGGIL